MQPQKYDFLIFEGRKTAMMCALPLPENHPRVVELSWQEAERRPYPERVMWEGFHTCRLHFATWEIRDGRLYLHSIAGYYRLEGDEPLFADWCTGILRVPQGDEIQSREIVYALDVDIVVERGVVRAFRVFSNARADFPWRAFPRRMWLQVTDVFPGPEAG